MKHLLKDFNQGLTKLPGTSVLSAMA